LKRSVLLLGALLALSGIANSQDKIYNNPRQSFNIIGVKGGLNQIKEEILIGRVYSGFITDYSYEFRKIKTDYRDFQFSLGLSRPKARPEEFSKSANINLNVASSFCFRILESNSFRFYCGPQGKISYSAALFPNWDESHLYWADSYSIGIKGISSKAFKNNSQLFATISIPLLSVYSRPDLVRKYKYDNTTLSGVLHNLNSNLKPGFWNRAFFLEYEMEYQIPIFSKKYEAFTYSFKFVRIQNKLSKPYTQIIHQFGLKILL
jgi:hypothetical protein